MLIKKEEHQKEHDKIIRRDPDIGDKHSRRPPNVLIHEHLFGYVDKQRRDLEDLRSS